MEILIFTILGPKVDSGPKHDLGAFGAIWAPDVSVARARRPPKNEPIFSLVNNEGLAKFHFFAKISF